jgi:hypothetical protein
LVIHIKRQGILPAIRGGFTIIRIKMLHLFRQPPRLARLFSSFCVFFTINFANCRILARNSNEVMTFATATLIFLLMRTLVAMGSCVIFSDGGVRMEPINPVMSRHYFNCNEGRA